MEDLFAEVTGRMDGTGLDREEMLKRFIAREESSSTALSPFFAIPHIVVDRKETFRLIVVRSPKGIPFNEMMGEVHSIYFLAGSQDQRHFHLVVLSALARIVQHPRYEKEWMEAETAEDLRDLVKGIASEL